MIVPTSRFSTDKLDREDEPVDLDSDLKSGGVVSFLIAGMVLFASLVVGFSISLILAGSQAPITAVLRDYLTHGVWGLGALFAAVLPVLAIAAILRHRRDSGN